jgi:hypothetical protein
MEKTKRLNPKASTFSYLMIAIRPDTDVGRRNAVVFVRHWWFSTTGIEGTYSLSAGSATPIWDSL